MLWKAAVPFAQSSPVVAGGRVYVTAGDGDRLVTIAFDAATGREAWRRSLARSRAHQIYKTNDPASPTPAADEHGVVVFFADVGLAAYAPDGTPQWTLPLGPFRNFYGMAGSPIIAGDAVILVCDQMSGSFMLALDRRTGRERWRRARPGSTVSWTTPMVFAPGGSAESQLIVLSSTRLDGYALATGLKAGAQWEVLGVNDLGDEIHATPALSGGRIYVRTRDALYCFGAAAKS